MSSQRVDLSTNSYKISSTHKRILEGDEQVSWAVFGFSRGGNELDVEATGGDGLEEMIEEFDSGKIQYGFARVTDPSSKLNKFIFISWCGSGVPVFRKGIMSSQVGEVQNVLRNYHVAIEARTEDDLEAGEILRKIAESSGANYSGYAGRGAGTGTGGAKPRVKPVVYSAPKPAVIMAPGMKVREVNKVGVGIAQQKKNVPIPVTKPVAGFGASAARTTPTATQPVATKPLFEVKGSSGKLLSSIYGGGGGVGAGAGVGVGKEIERKNVPKSVTSPFQTSPPPPPPQQQQQQQRQRQQSIDIKPESPKTQAQTTREELEMLRNRRAVPPSQQRQQQQQQQQQQPEKRQTPAEERQAELDAIRQVRGGIGNMQVKEEEESRDSTKRRYSNTVRKISTPKVETQREVEMESGKQAKVIYSYQAEEANEMDLVEGEIIYCVEQTDDEYWWSGRSADNKRSGQFPANFVEPIESQQSIPPPPPPHQPQPQLQSSIPPPPPPSQPRSQPQTSIPPPPPPPQRNRSPSPPPPPPLPQRSQSPPPPPLPQRSQPPQQQEQVPSLPPRQQSYQYEQHPEPEPVPVPVPVPVPEQGHEQTARAIYDYIAAEEGELSFQEGELIRDVQFPSDEWWQGINESGEFGLFPGNYVTLN